MSNDKLENIIFGLKETIAEKDAEIERLTEEMQAYIKDYEFVKNEYASALMTLREESEAKAELQKQVDELKEENAQLSEMADYDKGHKEGYEHGAKTTAKEIIRWIKLNGILEYGGYVIHDSTIEQMCKKFGVEVE